MVKVVFFDFGGVLVGHMLRGFGVAMQDRFGVPAPATDDYWHGRDDDYYAGRIDAETFYARYAEAVGVEATPAELEQLYLACIREEPDTWVTARRLRKQVRLSVISDMAPAPTSHIKQHCDMGLFTQPVFSSDVGLTKQDERVFEYALQQLGVAAEESLFIDDSSANIRLATGVGMQAVLFEAAEQLEADLRALGLG